MGGQHHAPAALPPGKTRYPLYRWLGGPQGRSGRVRKISPPTGFWSPDRPARSKSLYRLSYRGRYFSKHFTKRSNSRLVRIRYYLNSMFVVHTMGGPKIFSELLKKKRLFKIFVKFWNFSQLQSRLSVWPDTAIPAPLLLLVTLFEIFNGNAVKGSHLVSLDICNARETPPFRVKTKWCLCFPQHYSPDPALCDWFLFPAMNRDLKWTLLLTLQEVQRLSLTATDRISFEDFGECFQQGGLHPVTGGDA